MLKHEYVPKGQIICHEGDRDARMLIILAGSISFSQSPKNNGSITARSDSGSMDEANDGMSVLRKGMYFWKVNVIAVRLVHGLVE